MAPGRLEAERSINDGREEVSPIMTIAGKAADPPAIGPPSTAGTVR